MTVVNRQSSIVAAYQYQPNPKGIFLRLSYAPVATTEAIAPLWGAFALGWAFCFCGTTATLPPLRAS